MKMLSRLDKLANKPVKMKKAKRQLDLEEDQMPAPDYTQKYASKTRSKSSKTKITKRKKALYG